MKGIEDLLAMLVNIVVRVAPLSAAYVIQTAGDDEAIEIPVEANALFRVDRIRWPRHSVYAVPTNVNPTPRSAGDVEAAVYRDFESDACRVSNDKQPLSSSWTIFYLQQPNVPRYPYRPQCAAAALPATFHELTGPLTECR